MTPRVAITECNRYDYSLVKEAVFQLADNTDFPLVEGKTVLVKTNILSDAKPERGITTNPIVIKAIIDLLKSRGAERIWVGDSPGLPGPNFRGQSAGIWEVCQETGATWVDFSDGPITRTFLNNIKVPQCRFLTEADVVISACKMKTHQLMYATGAVKNMFGTVPGLNKSPMHLKAPDPDDFAALILALYRTHEPEWAVMDGIISMEGAGPANGTLRQTNLLMASSSCLALDKAEAIVMGYHPSDIPILRMAEKEQKGCTDGVYPLLNPKDLIIKDYRRIPAKKRSLFSALILPRFQRGKERRDAAERKAPVFEVEKCKQCKKCIDICPAKALTLSGKQVVINESKCIRCYCCHEMCPFDAIKVAKVD